MGTFWAQIKHIDYLRMHIER